MKHIFRVVLSAAVLSVSVFAFAQIPLGSGVPKRAVNVGLPHGPGNIKLLEGYLHYKLQGIDSTPGKIQHKDGFEIFYEQGRIAKPGEPRLGGDFSNSALALKNSKKVNVEWFAHQKIGDQSVDMVLLKSGLFAASFPESGINFSANTKNKSQIADMLVMIMTYPVKQN